MEPNTLNIFLAVVFITSPTVFRIVRGLTLDIKTRDYVAAAQTRGERPWYMMMWEILPNARGPLIVDACLRIGYTTILLGTLGFFGLGVSPESPDWGSTINEGRKLLRVFVHPALPPALAIMSLVLGLNLLADALREQTLEGLSRMRLVVRLVGRCAAFWGRRPAPSAAKSNDTVYIADGVPVASLQRRS